MEKSTPSRLPPIAPAVAASPATGHGRAGRPEGPRHASAALIEAPPARHRFFIVSLVLVMVGVGAAGFFATLKSAWHTSTAQPGVILGQVDVSGMDKAELAWTVTSLAASVRLSLSYEDKTQIVSLAEVGVEPDVEKTVAAALKADPGSSLIAGRTQWAEERVPLSFTVAESITERWLADNFATGAEPPVDASIRYDEDADAFTVTPSRSGWTFDLAPLRAALDTVALNPEATPSCSFQMVEADPAIRDSAALAAADRANVRLGLSLTFSAASGSYTATTADIAGWIDVVPDPMSGTVGLEYEPGRIAEDLAAKLDAALEQAGRPARSVAAADGRVLKVVDEGAPGVAVGDVTDVARTLTEMLDKGTNVDLAVPVAETEPGTVTTTLSGPAPTTGQWIDVDLTSQVTTLFEGDTVVRSFIISSGKSETPTPPGTYHVYLKVPIQDMTGLNADGTTYHITDVPWDTWFYGNYGFHTAYWLDESQLGTPQSHGCINMRLDDAKFVYDWAPIQTTVVVHGTEPVVPD